MLPYTVGLEALEAIPDFDPIGGDEGVELVHERNTMQEDLHDVLGIINKIGWVEGMAGEGRKRKQGVIVRPLWNPLNQIIPTPPPAGQRVQLIIP